MFFLRVSGSGEPVPAFRGFVFSGSAGKPVLPSISKSSGIQPFKNACYSAFSGFSRFHHIAGFFRTRAPLYRFDPVVSAGFSAETGVQPFRMHPVYAVPCGTALAGSLFSVTFIRFPVRSRLFVNNPSPVSKLLSVLPVLAARPVVHPEYAVSCAGDLTAAFACATLRQPANPALLHRENSVVRFS